MRSAGYSTSDLARQLDALVRVAAPYVLALLAVLVVLLAKDLLPGSAGSPFLLLGVAVVVASYFGGPGPGLLATAIGAIGVDVRYLSPFGRLTFDAESEAWLAAFALEGLVITFATDALRRTRGEARAMASRERAAREAAEGALRVRDTFLSIASHELRTPLTTIAAATQLALRRAQPVEGAEGVVEVLGQTLAATRRMERLIQNVLDLNQLQRGGMVLNLEEFDLAALICDVADGVRLTAASDRRIDVIGPSMLVIRGDPLRLEEAIKNLLDNALKYSPNTEDVEVRVERHARSAAISVRDHGAGIPPEARERIFEPYHRERPADVRGMGLGLAVVREVVRLHGGEIAVRAPVDGGSIFEIVLPAGPS